MHGGRARTQIETHRRRRGNSVGGDCRRWIHPLTAAQRCLRTSERTLHLLRSLVALVSGRTIRPWVPLDKNFPARSAEPSDGPGEASDASRGAGINDPLRPEKNEHPAPPKSARPTRPPASSTVPIHLQKALGWRTLPVRASQAAIHHLAAPARLEKARTAPPACVGKQGARSQILSRERHASSAGPAGGRDGSAGKGRTKDQSQQDASHGTAPKNAKPTSSNICLDPRPAAAPRSRRGSFCSPQIALGAPGPRSWSGADPVAATKGRIRTQLSDLHDGGVPALAPAS